MIDTSAWKEFNMSDIGFKNFHGIRQKQSDRTEGNTPLLTAGKENQGVASYIGNPPSTYIDSITVDMFGNSFFHKGVYAGDDNIYFFVNDNVSDEAKLFIAAIINTDNTPKYAFKDQFRQPQADALSVHLPATSDGQPDWDYMESYMKAVMEESEKSLENLKKADNTKHLIDVSGWGEFRVGDLFEKLQAPCNSKKAKREIISEVPDDSHTLPLVYAAKRNNGIIYWGDEKDFTAYSNVISIIYNGAVAAGTVYAQEQNTGILAESYFIRLKEHPDIPFLVNLYLSKVIENVIYYKYTRDDLAVWDGKVEDCYIKLPITSTGEPDWQYMEDYMRNVMDKSEQIISDLQIGA